MMEQIQNELQDPKDDCLFRILLPNFMINNWFESTDKNLLANIGRLILNLKSMI